MRTIGLVLFLISLTSCSTTEPPDNYEPVLKLELEDVSCTEAWITLTTANLQLPTTITLKQNEETLETINLSTTDSLFYIDSLLPNLTYTFKATCHSGLSGISSNELSVTTMDTTSHNFTWQTWTFGEHGNSVLYDVAIVNENCIYAVGEIYMYDSLGRADPNAYNAVYWDGQKWELKKIGGQGGWTCHTVYAFSANDIWFEGNIHWNGSIYTVHMNGWPLMPNGDGWQVNKMWGSSSSDLYAVGNGGNIAHYNGSSWTKIESGTTVELLDVWGTPDGSIVWVSGKVDLSKSVLIKIQGSQANIVFEDQYPWQIQKGRISGGISSIWTNSKNFIYATTPITVYRCLSGTSGEGIEIYPYDDYLNGGTVRIRGTVSNNIVTSGSNSSILHYNGFSWKRYEELKDNMTYLWSSDLKENIIVSVGDRLENILYYKAIIIVGKK